MPGDLLPSEPELAADLGVSPGTVRKALDEMTADRLVVRRQGRGTYLARHDDARILFQFFRLMPDDGGPRSFPDSRFGAVATGAADADEAEALALPQGAPVVRVARVRSLGGAPVVAERLVLPHALFPGIEARTLPNNLYQLYATDYGLAVTRAAERLRAVAAGAGDAAHLGVPPGAPLLRVDRIAYAPGEVRAEWRLSLYRTDAHHYAADLR